MMREPETRPHHPEGVKSADAPYWEAHALAVSRVLGFVLQLVISLAREAGRERAESGEPAPATAPI
jgi:hypothetical protein